MLITNSIHEQKRKSESAPPSIGNKKKNTDSDKFKERPTFINTEKNCLPILSNDIKILVTSLK